jgi:transcription initiation factor IIE alpha subunit
MLATEGELTQGQLAAETVLPERTVRNALEQLTETGLVTARPCTTPQAGVSDYVYRTVPGTVAVSTTSSNNGLSDYLTGLPPVF